MKFEQALPLLRSGSKVKCGNQSGYFIVCKQALFDMDLGLTIYKVDSELGAASIFHWGVPGNALLSEEWYIHTADEQQDTKEIQSILHRTIQQTIFNFFMDITKPFTPENAFLPPLAEPLADKITNMLKQFFDIGKVIE